jgi:hypothetical protein
MNIFPSPGKWAESIPSWSRLLFRPAGEWVRVSITVVENVHTFMLDGAVVLTATDAQPLPPGGVMLRRRGQVASSMI